MVKIIHCAVVPTMDGVLVRGIYTHASLYTGSIITIFLDIILRLNKHRKELASKSITILELISPNRTY